MIKLPNFGCLIVQIKFGCTHFMVLMHVYTRLMQMVHLNNVEAMKFVRRSKSPVEVDNIKQIVAKDAQKNPTISNTGNLSHGLITWLKMQPYFFKCWSS